MRGSRHYCPVSSVNHCSTVIYEICSQVFIVNKIVVNMLVYKIIGSKGK